MNAETMDSEIGKNIKSVYTVPTWVTSANMASTVDQGQGRPGVPDLRGSHLQKACQSAGIS